MVNQICGGGGILMFFRVFPRILLEVNSRGVFWRRLRVFAAAVLVAVEFCGVW